MKFKIGILVTSYVILYYFLVNKLYAATGEWNWNLFAHFGIIRFGIVSAGYLLFGVLLSKINIKNT